MNCAIGSGRQDRIAVNDRFDGDSCLEFRSVGWPLAHHLEPHSGGIPASDVTQGSCPEKSDQLKLLMDIKSLKVLTWDIAERAEPAKVQARYLQTVVLLAIIK